VFKTAQTVAMIRAALLHSGAGDCQKQQAGKRVWRCCLYQKGCCSKKLLSNLYNRHGTRVEGSQTSRGRLVCVWCVVC